MRDALNSTVDQGCDKVDGIVNDIVVVDSHPHDYETLIADAPAWKFRIQVLTSGSEAIRSPIALFGGLWLINTRLPDMAGVELLLLIRERDPNATVFLVADSYDHDEEIAARSAGTTAYLCKPPQSSWLGYFRPDVRAGPLIQTPHDNTYTQPVAYY